MNHVILHVHAYSYTGCWHLAHVSIKAASMQTQACVMALLGYTAVPEACFIRLQTMSGKHSGGYSCTCALLYLPMGQATLGHVPYPV